MWFETSCGGLSALSPERALYCFALSSLLALQGAGQLEGKGAGGAAGKLPGQSRPAQVRVCIQGT